MHRSRRELESSDLERLNIGRRFWSAMLRRVAPGPAREQLVAYTSRLPEMRRRGVGLYLYGANGVGKTYAACAVLKEAARLGYSAYCLLSDRLRQIVVEDVEFDEDETVSERIGSVDFLLLEDLGKDYAKSGSEWSQLALENLLRNRSKDCKVTLFTSNLAQGDLLGKYNKSVSSLVTEMTVAVNMQGPDLRVKYRQQLEAEFAITKSGG